MQRIWRAATRGAALAVALTLGACATSTSAGQTPPPEADRAPTPVPRPASASVEAPQSFEAWRAGFRRRALAAGIAPATFDRAFAGVAPNPDVIELDSRQPEFTRPIWEYLDSAVSETRISTGRRHAADKRALLGRIESRYGVDRAVLLAIWGLESAYGGNFGAIPVVESMATLAYDGRRKAFAEEQLIAALQILQAGDIAPDRMLGSWAGAMGHTQFIPTSFLAYAVDFDGDGRRDVWAADAADALASAANYLSSFGWSFGAPAAVEVTLPDGFDYRLADDSTRMRAAEWAARGVGAVSGTLPAGDGVAILLPAGARGPAFATYPNFRVIKRYNNATSYALAVAQLARRIDGGPAIRAGWPRGDRALSRDEKQELQRRLTALGFDTQGIDGIIGPNSRAAVRGFQGAQGMIPDGYVSAALLDAVRGAGG